MGSRPIGDAIVNIKAAGFSGPVPGLRCSSCKKILCVACLASLQKIEEGSDIAARL